jgi:hypothetical protein
VARRRLRSALALLALTPLAVAAGCGSDDEASPRPPAAPKLTVPREAKTEPATTDTGTAAEPAPAPAPQTDTSGASPAPRTQPGDSPQNDRPPPKGSPADKFEKFCDENPGACG